MSWTGFSGCDKLFQNWFKSLFVTKEDYQDKVYYNNVIIYIFFCNFLSCFSHFCCLSHYVLFTRHLFWNKETKKVNGLDRQEQGIIIILYKL